MGWLLAQNLGNASTIPKRLDSYPRLVADLNVFIYVQ